MKARKSLVEMAAGEGGVLAEVQGGQGLARRLEAMGLRPGVPLTKMSGPYLRGPVAVRAGNAEVAIGFGMAGRVIVEVEAGGRV